MNKLTSIAVLCTVLSGNAMASCDGFGEDMRAIRGWADSGTSEAAAINSLNNVFDKRTNSMPGHRELVLLTVHRIYTEEKLESLGNFEQYMYSQVETCKQLGVKEFVSRNRVVHPNQQPVQQASGGSTIGAFFDLFAAIATPFAKGYVDQGNENARNRSGRNSAPNYTCTTTGGMASEYGKLPSSTSCMPY